MFKNLTSKKKFYGMLIGLGLLFVVSCAKSILPTYKIIENYGSAKEKTKNTFHALEEIKDLQEITKQLDYKIGKQTEKPALVQNKILDFLSSNQDEVTIANIDKLNISQDSYFKIYSNTLILKGDYNTLLKTVYHFENEFNYARIASIKLYIAKNKRTKKNELFNKIIFQNYEKTD